MSSLDDLIGPVLAVLFALALAAERLFPRDTTMPLQRLWRWRGVGWFVVVGAVNTLLPLAVPVDWIAGHSLLPGVALGLPLGALAGWVVNSGIYYFWHRFEHHHPLPWRWLHQLHHSALRVDTAGFAFLHPFDVAAQGLLSIGVMVFVLGLHPDAVAIVGLYTVVASLVQHLNLRTPRWLEWFMQRPEAHLRHHEFGQHAGNYADWPVWDKLFGTYRAPPAEGAAPLRYGFERDASARVGAMLLGVDVNDGAPPLANDRRAPAAETSTARFSARR